MNFRRLGTVAQDFSFAGDIPWERILVALGVLIVGIVVLRISARLFSKHILRNLREQSREMVRKALVYTGALFLIVGSLRAAGVEITALLGAAGVVGIAIGIASQASLSNIISGLFLVSERFFEIGDVVRVSGHVGTIHAIDLLSIKIKTFDNVLVRIPNQQIIETDFVNITRFPVRRMDFNLTLPFDLDITLVMEALQSATERVPDALAQPEPFIMYTGHTGDGWTLLLGVWFERSDYVSVRNSVAIEIQKELRDRGIHLTGNYLSVSLSSERPFDRPSPSS